MFKHKSHSQSKRGSCVPKLCGGDYELGNFVLGLDLPKGTGALASRALLKQIQGLPIEGSSWTKSECNCASCVGRRELLETGLGYDAASLGTMIQASASFNAQDWGRKFLKENGGCAYIDLDHLEMCLPEVLSAYDHVACSHAMLRIARDALTSANARLKEGFKIVALANNSDGQGHSYGTHLDFLVTRAAWDNLFHLRMHHLLYLTAYQTSSIVITGQGKVGSENGRPHVPYQISQRADFFEVLTSLNTTINRPIVNSRDEALCGCWEKGPCPARSMARLHVIFYDHSLCHVAALLKLGIMQIILTMIEAERINPSLILEDPLPAVLRWSHDPSLHARAALTSGKQVTAVELQMLFLEDATKFVEKGGCDGIVPRAREIVALWADTLSKLKAANFAALAPRLDWVLKHSILQTAMEQHPELTWDSPQVKQLDFLYSSLEDGLYWQYEKAGLIEKIVTDGQIERFVHEPPEDTRAWTRAMLLRAATPEEVESVDWDGIRFRRDTGSYCPSYRTLYLANPLAFGKAHTERILDGATDIDSMLDRLGAEPESNTQTLPAYSYPSPFSYGTTSLPPYTTETPTTKIEEEHHE